MTDKKTSTELTIPQRAAVALGSAEHEIRLKELATKHADIVEIKNPAGREQAHAAMMVLANTRVAITKAGKVARDDANAFSKAVITEVDRLVAIIEPEEARLRGLRDDWDAEREREKQAKANAEKNRIAALQERIVEIRGAVAAASTCPSALVLEHIGDIERMVIDASFEEFQGQAQLAKDETLDKLREIHAAAVAREEEAARLVAEREELERLRKEAAAREAADAAARAEAERKAREEREAEERRLAAERAAQEATLRAEREAHERKLAAERAEQEAKLRAQREEEERISREAEAKARAEREEADRVAREKWKAEQEELQAERDRQAAEAKRLADERAELERQQREAEEQRRRDEAARQAQADASEKQVRDAAYLMLDALRQWRYAEQTNDSQELENARTARDQAIDAATLVDAEFVEAA